MKVLNQLFKKTKTLEKNLKTAAEAIVNLENKLVNKEEKAVDLRKNLETLYGDSVLGKKNSMKIAKAKTALEENQAEIAGIRAVIESAKEEAVTLAEKEIQENEDKKVKLQEQMKHEATDENKKILTSLQKLFAAIYLKYGVRSAVSRDPSFRVVFPTNEIDNDLLEKANKELISYYDSTNSGTYFTSEQISKIEEQTAKADPANLVETALHDARN